MSNEGKESKIKRQAKQDGNDKLAHLSGLRF